MCTDINTFTYLILYLSHLVHCFTLHSFPFTLPYTNLFNNFIFKDDEHSNTTFTISSSNVTLPISAAGFIYERLSYDPKLGFHIYGIDKCPSLLSCVIGSNDSLVTVNILRMFLFFIFFFVFVLFIAKK